MVNWERLFDKKDLNAQFIALNETYFKHIMYQISI